MKPKVEINQTLCTGCTACVDVCKLGVLYMDDFTGLCKVRHEEHCDQNGACVKVCEPGAIRLNR